MICQVIGTLDGFSSGFSPRMPMRSRTKKAIRIPASAYPKTAGTGFKDICSLAYSQNGKCGYDDPVLCLIVVHAVPIYDARAGETPFKLCTSSLFMLDRLLTRYTREVPEGAIVLLAYTTSKFQSEVQPDVGPKWFSISHNLLWVAVLAA